MTKQSEQMELDLKTTKKDLLMVSPMNIMIDKDFNTRTDFGEMEELVASIIENGVLNPIKAYSTGLGDGKYVLVDGERRFRAVMIALERGNPIVRIPVIPVRKKSKEELTFEIITNNEGKPLTPIEKGVTYARLLNYGYAQSEIAKKIGRSVAHVSQMISLVENTPAKVQNMIQGGEVSANVVIQASKFLPDANELTESIENAVENKKTEARESGKKEKKVKLSDVSKTSGGFNYSLTIAEVISKHFRGKDQITIPINNAGDCDYNVLMQQEKGQGVYNLIMVSSAGEEIVLGKFEGKHAKYVDSFIIALKDLTMDLK